MATAEQILNLVKANNNHDEQKFRTIVLQIAAHEAKMGHTIISQELKKEADKTVKTQSSIMRVAPKNESLQFSYPDVSMPELIVSNEIRAKIDRILLEYRNKNKLKKNGLCNRRKILLEGVSGTGKTMTAAVIATELKMPLFTVRVDKLVTKYMGETSVRLRQIFDSMSDDIGVYLFDEFDAIGADRSLDNEVGEMRRILNAFLQFIENDMSESIILAATNNFKMLDKALYRRFEDVIHYDLPDDEQIRRLYELKLYGYIDVHALSQSTIEKTRGLNHAEISLICDDAVKESVLFNKNVNNQMINRLLEERHRMYEGKEA